SSPHWRELQLPREPRAAITHCSPAKGCLRSQCCNEWPPDGVHVQEGYELDRSKQASRGGDARQGRLAQVGRREDAWRQTGADLSINPLNIDEPEVTAAIEGGVIAPHRGEGPMDRADHAGEVCKGFQPREAAGIERTADRRVQVFG